MKDLLIEEIRLANRTLTKAGEAAKFKCKRHLDNMSKIIEDNAVPPLDSKDVNILLDLVLGRNYPTEFDSYYMLELSKKLRILNKQLQSGVENANTQPKKYTTIDANFAKYKKFKSSEEAYQFAIKHFGGDEFKYPNKWKNLIFIDHSWENPVKGYFSESSYNY